MRRLTLSMIVLLLPAGCLLVSPSREGTGNDGASGDETGEGGETGPGDGTATDEAGEDGAGMEDDDAGETKFDVNEYDDVASGGEMCGEPESTHSYIWISNSQQGTVSKLDTKTMVEEGRYLTRPSGSGNPSRTSVGSSGAVAVANRFGGVTKVRARPEHCDEALNGDAGLQTSSGADDVLAWGEDDCVAWYRYMNYSSQRPVQWAPGQWNEDSCTYEGEKVWTSGTTAGGDIDVVLLDGETGEIEEIVPIEGIPLKSYGLYGGAVDGDGNFWASQLGSDGKLVRVDRGDFSVQTWDVPINAYGITVGSDGRVYVCRDHVARFDPDTEEFAVAETGGQGGCMEDGEGVLWQAGDPVRSVDTETLMVLDEMGVGGHGISIDFDGYVWTVPAYGTQAHRIDPGNGDFQTYGGLSGAYTYSDMTGFALVHAGVPAG